MRRFVFMSIALLFIAGCSGATGDASSGSSTNDIFDVEDPSETKYCQATLPFAKAIASRNYSQAYDSVSPLAFEDVHAIQLKRISQPMEVDTAGLYKFAGDPSDRLGKVSKEKFVEILTANESLGIPAKLEEIAIEDIFEDEPCEGFLGSFPEDFPFEKVKATLTGTVVCKMNDESMNNFEEQYEWEVAGECWLTFFVMIIEDEGVLKVGYVDFRNMSTEE